MAVAEQTAAAILEGLARLGVDPTRLGVTRLTEDEDLALLWQRSIARAGRVTVPLEVGLGLPLGVLGAIDYLAASSLTVGAALTVTQQIFPLVGPGVQLVLDEPRAGARRVAVVDYPPFPGEAECDAFLIGAIVARLRLLTGRPLDFTLVELAQPEPPDPDTWRALLDVPRVTFGARRAALHMRSATWAVPLRSADPRLFSMLQELIGVDQRSADALLMAVRSLATRRLPGLLDLEYAAPALGVSRRTLQRKLAKVGTSFELIVDEVRRARAWELVATGQLTCGEVAARVGFAEQASFTRAWRRWFGEAPSRSRRHERERRESLTSP